MGASLRRPAFMYSPSFHFSTHATRPLFYLRGVPFYFTTVLTVVHVVCFILGALVSTARWNALAGFQCPSSLEQGRLWTLLSYPFVHPVSIFFVIDMLVLFFMGRVLEEQLGRRFLVLLYTGLVIIAPSLHTAAWLVDGAHRAVLFSTSSIHLCLFLAVAFLEPNAHFFWSWFKLKWAALAFFLIAALQLLNVRDTVGLLALAANAGFTYALMRWSGLGARFDWLRERLAPAGRERLHPKGRWKGRAQPVPFETKLKPRADLPEEHPAVQRIDAVLEKIASQGMGSLTEEERRLLEKASNDLRAKDE